MEGGRRESGGGVPRSTRAFIGMGEERKLQGPWAPVSDHCGLETCGWPIQRGFTKEVASHAEGKVYGSWSLRTPLA